MTFIYDAFIYDAFWVLFICVYNVYLLFIC